MKSKNRGFTIVELLTVVAIIAILVGLLVPSLRMVRNMAKNTKQKAQFATIDMALMAFRSDYGQYSPSGWPAPGIDYCGAQKLAEALLGRDLMGFHPNSDFRTDDGAYPVGGGNLDERRGPYLELATASAFKLGDLFLNTGILNGDTFVLCDVFGVRKITLLSGETVMAGTPILYYRANTSSKNLTDIDLGKRIYDARNNRPLVQLGSLTMDGRVGREHPLGIESTPPDYPVFYDYDYRGGIRDPKVTNIAWPYRPDSYILISAGADGLYGTRDDVHNF